MTWNTQSTTDTIWTRQTGITPSWSAAVSSQVPYHAQSTLIVTSPGPGTFNVSGQTFNQSRILFNRTVANGKQDVTYTKQSANQTAWRQQ